MSDDSRLPGVCPRPWDPGESCKVGIGACLPPRKRLLAGLKQSGLLSSSSSYLQSCNGASCSGLMEDLKLEVDLAEANLDSNGDTCFVVSTAGKQGECNAIESPVSVKTKKALRRRKSLSVLADCQGPVNKLQSEALKVGPGGKIEKKFRSKMETVVTSNGEKESDPSYKERVDAARAAAATAAKAAAEARAIALDKAAAAAKAAAVAKSALEALALAPYDDKEWGFQSYNHVRALNKHKRRGDKLKQESKREAALSSVLCTEGVSVLSEKMEEEKRLRICHTSLEKEKEDEHMRISHVNFPPVGMSACRDKIKVDERTESHQFLIVDLANAPSDKIIEDEQAHLNHDHSVGCPPPPPLDDEKFARQLHRVMNSSPRISRYRAPVECSNKLETASFSSQGCIQNKDLRAGGCNLSRAKKPMHKEKTRVSRTSIGRPDVKVKSMSAINETLNMLQGTSPSQYRVLGGMVSCCAASEEHTDNMCVKEDLSMPAISNRAPASLIKSNEQGDKLTVNNDSASSCKLDVEARSTKVPLSSYPCEPCVVGADNESRAETIKKLKSRSKLITGDSLIAASPGSFKPYLHSRAGNGIDEIRVTSAENHATTFCNAISEAAGSHFVTPKDYFQVNMDENKGRVSEPGFGSTIQVAGECVKEMSTNRNTQENSFCEISSRATHNTSTMSLPGERHMRRQKVLGVMSNSLSKDNQNFGGNLSLPSYMPSPTVS